MAVSASAQVQTTASGDSLSFASTASASSATGGPVTHTVAVAKGGHTFIPDVTLAEVGDIIEFQFYPTNHSVIRAAYGYPCVPYEMVLGVGHYGFFSGWEPVDAVLADPPKWQVEVNDTEPIFYYCGAPNSCIGYGMVGVINPNASTSLQHQRQLAEESTFSLVPGEDWPNEGSIPSGVAKTSTSAAPTATSAAPAATVTAATSNSGGHGLGTGAIAGIAIGGAAVLVMAAVAIWFCGRQSRRNQHIPMAPAQEIHQGYNPAVPGMYVKPGHMSMVSGYSVPPGYDNSSVRSPNSTTPVDPMMGQAGSMRATTPNSPMYAPNYATHVTSPGTHHIIQEMDGVVDGRYVVEKQPGVERYS